MRLLPWLLILGCAGPREGDDTALVGAADSAPAAASCAASPALTVGTGHQELAILQPGDPLQMVNGPQDGWHLWFGAEVEGLGEAVAVEAVAELDGGGRIAGVGPVYLGLAGYDPEACSGVFFGRELLLEPPPGEDAMAFVCGLDDVEVRVEVVATSLETGASASGTALARVALDPIDEPACE